MGCHCLWDLINIIVTSSTNHILKMTTDSVNKTWPATVTISCSVAHVVLNIGQGLLQAHVSKKYQNWLPSYISWDLLDGPDHTIIVGYIAFVAFYASIFSVSILEYCWRHNQIFELRTSKKITSPNVFTKNLEVFFI